MCVGGGDAAVLETSTRLNKLQCCLATSLLHPFLQPGCHSAVCQNYQITKRTHYSLKIRAREANKHFEAFYLTPFLIAWNNAATNCIVPLNSAIFFLSYSTILFSGFCSP